MENSRKEFEKFTENSQASQLRCYVVQTKKSVE